MAACPGPKNNHAIKTPPGLLEMAHSDLNVRTLSGRMALMDRDSLNKIPLATDSEKFRRPPVEVKTDF